MIKRLLQNIRSLIHDGLTLGQKKKYVRLHYPTLYKLLYEEES